MRLPSCRKRKRREKEKGRKTKREKVFVNLPRKREEDPKNGEEERRGR